MHKTRYQFSRKEVTCCFDADFSTIGEMAGGADIIFITDENVFNLHRHKLAGLPVIKMQAGEAFKNQETVDRIIAELIEAGAHKETLLIGVGGGVVTDVTGFAAAVYMRGLRFGLVPTTVLAMVDAAIGGKNGIDVGLYKNLVGTIRQPDFIFYDYSFLDTLPVPEWINGFAEIIKHACIKDAALFAELESHTLHDYQANRELLAALIEKNAAIKAAVVMQDEFEKGDRKLLNFGHTIGHAVENLYQLPHGHAISIGMVAACNLSEKSGDLHFGNAANVVRLLHRYHLPVDMEIDHDRVFEVLQLDKKRKGQAVQFILLKQPGKAVIKEIALTDLKILLKELL